MKLSSIFYEYLVENLQLQVQGFGVFETEIVDPYIHPISGEISPAMLDLKFRLDKNTTDSGFISFASKKLGVANQEIALMLLAERNDWILQLKKGNDVTFDLMGSFKLNAKGSVVFTAFKSISLNKNHFGLSAFTLTPVVQITEPKPKVVLSDKSKKRKFPWAISIAAFIVLGIGLGTWFYYPSVLEYFNKNQKQLSFENSKTDSISVDPIDTLQVAALQTDSVLTDSLIVDSVVNQEVEKVVEPQIDASTETYYLVVAGCFLDESKANDYLQILKNKGYDASIEGKTNHGLTRVCSGKFSSKTEANNASNEFNLKENKSSWIQKIN